MINDLFDELTFYQERMHRKSKEKFRKYLKMKANENGINHSLLPDTFVAKNVVIGDLKNAKYVLGAHYDTPPRMPSLLMKNVKVFNILSIAIIPIFIIVLVILKLPPFIFLITWFVSMLYLMGVGVANKYNFNDNTSGVITLLALMEKIKSDKVAYVFFDNEEKGLLGSLQLSMIMKKDKKYFPRKKVFINFDCVGVGNVFGITSFNNKEYAQKIMDLNTNDIISFEHRKPSMFEGSDHFSFKNWNSMGIMCYNRKGKKYSLNNMHCHKDKIINLKNIEILVNLVQEYIDKDVDNNG